MDNGFVNYVRSNKKVLYVCVFIALGVFLILISLQSDKENVETDEQTSLEEYKEVLEGELASLCSDVSGVGKCRVFITFERGSQNTYKGSSIIETKPPRVLGVTIVCRGAENDDVRSELIDMITALFGIGSNRVAILKLNS